MLKRLLLIISHSIALVFGISIGIYLLPILTAPPSPDAATIASIADTARYHGQFRRDLPGSDLLHWGQGRVSVSDTAIAFSGELAPGPDYKLYLAPRFIQTAEEFLEVKSASIQVGEVRSFDGFVLKRDASVDIDAYDTIVIWCETFNKFITAARYR
ncbi:MAG: DM13 domain-containing protein [Gammaproteobacteria bacterium]|nr:DM13 domain-containing protein [Gammaproteobacteria bacterium]